MTQVASGPPRQKRGKMLRSEKHRRFVAWHACVVCAGGELVEQIGGHSRALSQAAHVSYVGRKHEGQRGKQEKASDVWIVPLCWKCHHEQGLYLLGERMYWRDSDIDPEPICLELARNSPDKKIRDAAELIEINAELNALDWKVV